MKKLFITFFWCCIMLQGLAQDPHFSQYYASPLSLNPAFAGTSQAHRFTANHRKQWPNLSNGFVTSSFSYDYNFRDVRSGMGVIATVDKAGSAGLKSTLVNFVYSYKIRFAKGWVLTPGLYFGYGQRSIDFNKLIFGDQLMFNSDGKAPTADLSLTDLGSSSYFDFGTGGLIYNKTFWAGFSFSHLNTPNRSLLEEESIVPIKKSIHAGVRIPLYKGLFKKDRISSLSPSFVYQHQGSFDQLDIGLHFSYHPVMVGLWYRGIPIQQNVADNVSHDAVVLIMGLQFDDLEFGYSYDMTVSQLGSMSGGAHEISLIYRLNTAFKLKTKKPEKFIPCPTFIK